jgi:hypothetical protein
MCGHVVLLNSYCNFQETAQKNSRPIGLNSPNFVTLLEVRLGIGAIAFPAPNESISVAERGHLILKNHAIFCQPF